MYRFHKTKPEAAGGSIKKKVMKPVGARAASWSGETDKTGWGAGKRGLGAEQPAKRRTARSRVQHRCTRRLIHFQRPYRQALDAATNKGGARIGEEVYLGFFRGGKIPGAYRDREKSQAPPTLSYPSLISRSRRGGSPHNILYYIILCYYPAFNVNKR